MSDRKFAHNKSRKLDATSNRKAQLSTMSNARLEFVSSSLLNLHSSQNIHHRLHQSTLVSIDGRLREMQGRLGLGAVHPGRAPSSKHRGSAGNQAIASHCDAAVVARRAHRFSLPFWKVITTYNSTAVEKGSHSHQARHTLAFIPPRWLSYVVLQWELRMCRGIDGGLLGMALSLTPVSYNPNPEFKAAITNFDIAALRGLFRDGIARSTDHVLLRKPMSLLEVGFRPHVIYHPPGHF